MRRLWAGGAILLPVFLAAATAPFWTPKAEPLRLDIPARLAAPGPGALLGTDHLGRDTASMLMLAAQNSLTVALLSVLLATVLGLAVGLSAAGGRGVVSAFTMRVMDVVFAFPPILSAMILSLVIGAGRTGAIIAIGLFAMPVLARVARAEARTVLAGDYVRAARAMGLPEARILTRHVLPNIAGGIAVQMSIQFGLAILTEAGLSFIGLGVPPPSPSWGRMLADSRTYLAAAPWLALAPGIAIAITVLGANLVGDGLADRLDPRRSSRN